MDSTTHLSYTSSGIRMNNIDLFRTWTQTTVFEARLVKIDNRVRLDGTGFLMRLLNY